MQTLRKQTLQHTMSFVKWFPRRMKCTSSKTHVPSPSESFTQSNTSRVKCRPIIPMHSSAGPVFANRAVDSSPLTKRPSCGTTAVQTLNCTKKYPRRVKPSPSGRAVKSMYTHVKLAIHRASSVLSAQLHACHRNLIRRLSGIPSVGVSSSMFSFVLCSQNKIQRYYHSFEFKQLLPFSVLDCRPLPLSSTGVCRSTSAKHPHPWSHFFYCLLTGFRIICRPPVLRRQANFLSPASFTPFSGPPIFGRVRVRTLSSVPTTRNKKQTRYRLSVDNVRPFCRIIDFLSLEFLFF